METIGAKAAKKQRKNWIINNVSEYSCRINIIYFTTFYQDVSNSTQMYEQFLTFLGALLSFSNIVIPDITRKYFF